MLSKEPLCSQLNKFFKYVTIDYENEHILNK